MGYYVNQINGKILPAKNKVKFLLENGAVRILNPTFQENLVCVVENIMFDAAAYAYSEDEMKCFNESDDLRTKTWLIVPNANELSGYKPNTND